MTQPKILVVDDEASVCEFLEILLEKEGYEVKTLQDPAGALEVYRNFKPQAVLVDIRMQPLDGLTLLGKLKVLDPEAKVVLMTAFASLDTAVRALREGALDYLIKPVKVETIRTCLKRVLSTQALTSRDEGVLKRLQAVYQPASIIGKSPLIQEVYKLINKVKDSQSTVLITGESGTGKELAARAIHYGGNRREKPFVSVNCGALPESLLESELFGHEKGSFTGAVRTKEGLFEVANGGSFLLDEVGEMSQAIQVKLLRALQEQEIMRIGGSKPIRVDVRVLAATSKDLSEEIKKGRFREDLFYRLNVIPVRMPSLRERREDIPGLAANFLESFSKREGKKAKEISPDARQMLATYDWPGNVRELQNLMERLVTLVDSDEIEVRDLPSHLKARSAGAGGSEGEPRLKERTDDFERKLIEETLAKTGGNVTRAASLLKLTRQGLQYKIDKYKVSGSGTREAGSGKRNRRNQ